MSLLVAEQSRYADKRIELMATTGICIVARPMRTRAISVLLLVIAASGCSQLDGRNRNRQGNRHFTDGLYPDAVAEYEKSLKEVDDPVIHYNAGLAYQKIFKAGYTKPILLAFQNEDVCAAIPNVKPVEASICVKENDRHYNGNECDDPKGPPCPALSKCVKTTFCSLDAKQVADMGAAHMQIWLKVQPSDEELKKQVKAVQKQISDLEDKLEKLAEKAEKTTDKADLKDIKQEIAAIEDEKKDLEKKVDQLHTKDRVRGLMTTMWIDSDQYPKALAYWTDLLKDKPNDPDIMGVLAGINLKGNDWRKSIEWYLKVADVATDISAKVAAYQFIGNVAWSKLNSKTLTAQDSVELADRGIGALQKAAALQPESPRPVGLQASIFNFRAIASGASWAGHLDRASAQDLQRASRVLSEKAKKAAEGAGAPAPAAPPTPSPAPAKTGG
jgi:tetratricopeptide (TPR) repeat protein